MRKTVTCAAVLLPFAAGAASLPRIITPAAPPPAAASATVATARAARPGPPGPGLRPILLQTVLDEAARQGVPPDLADAVAVVETGYTPSAIGTSGEIGLMQVMPGTAALLGFHGSLAELADPATNIHYGVAYLARAWQSAAGNPCRALMKYRAGVGQEGYSPLSLQYCHHAATWLAVTQSPLADQIAAATPTTADIADRAGAGGVIGGLWTNTPGGADLHEIAIVSGLSNVIIEGPSRPAHATRLAAGNAATVQSAVDAALAGTEADSHVVHIPDSPP